MKVAQLILSDFDLYSGYPDFAALRLIGSAKQHAMEFDAKHKLWVDNPGREDWLRRNPRTPTAGYRSKLSLDASKLIALPGLNNEHLKIPASQMSQNKIKKLAANMRANGFNPRASVMIEVYPNNPKPLVVEGNHRIRAALKADVPVLVEWRWCGGAEMLFSTHPVMFA